MGSGARNRRFIVATLLAAFATTFLPTPTVRAGDPFAINVAASGANGVGRITTPGRPCAEGGDGAYWHYEYGSPLPGGAFGNDASDLRFHLDVHSDSITQPQPGVLQPSRDGAPGPAAFLLGDASHASLINKRGTIKLRLTSGDCAHPTLGFDGVTASGAGTWQVGATAGSYRDATGSGTFSLARADVAPGADNPFQIQLNGAVEIEKPSLKVEVIGTYWGFLGLDYALRKVTVIYRITNTGPGDAFGVQLLSANSPTPGITPLGPVPQKLGDLLAGESTTARTRFHIDLLKPCDLVILNCKFTVTLGVNMPDAFDRPATLTGSVATQAPALPPPT